jgi:glycerate kinase
MSVRVLIVPDKFKGTLSARESAQAIARGWRKARPDDAIKTLPMSDGGDGFGEVMSRLLGAQSRMVNTVDAAHRRCQAAWWWEPRSKTAIIESAEVIGLAMLPPGKFHPFALDTFGLGAVLRAAQAKDAKQILIGIGGSATNDGGFGLARALGWEFLDTRGRLIEKWTELHTLADVRPPSSGVRTAESARSLSLTGSLHFQNQSVRADEAVRAPDSSFGKVIVAVDVQNRLLGAHGATRVYGPQKGLRWEDFANAECCLHRLADVVSCQLGQDYARRPGAGAAGGLGFGLAAFLAAELQPGFELFATHAKLSQRLRTVDLVITGEGAIDRSTAMGKGVGQIARRCRELEILCVGLAGTAIRSREVTRLFAEVHALTDLTTAAQAKTQPAKWLERLARRVGVQASACSGRAKSRSRRQAKVW